MEVPDQFYTMLNDGAGNYVFVRKSMVEAISVSKVTDTHYNIKFHMRSGSVQQFKIMINEYHNINDSYQDVEKRLNEIMIALQS